MACWCRCRGRVTKRDIVNVMKSILIYRPARNYDRPLHQSGVIWRENDDRVTGSKQVLVLTVHWGIKLSLRLPREHGTTGGEKQQRCGIRIPASGSRHWEIVCICDIGYRAWIRGNIMALITISSRLETNRRIEGGDDDSDTKKDVLPGENTESTSEF